MEEQNKSFIESAHFMLIKAHINQIADDGYINLLENWSRGECCQGPIKIASINKTGSGITRKLKCGHSSMNISMGEASDLGNGFNSVRLGMNNLGEQQVMARIIGGRVSKENREIGIIKLLCHHFKPDFNKFANDTQDSPTDVIAKNALGNVEHFQVTKLYNEEFWRELSKSGAIAKILPEIKSLVEAAIVRKKSFDVGSKAKIILVIDAWPGIMGELAKKIENLPILESAGFKEIWIAGSIPEMTFRLYPKT